MVIVEIVSIPDYAAADIPQVRYMVTNLFDKDIFLVNDNWFFYKYEDLVIELMFARTRVLEGVSVFGYFLPETQLIEAGASAEKSISLVWPLPLSTIWNEERFAEPKRGHNNLKISVGYGLSKNIKVDVALGLEESVFEWQRIVVSKEYDIYI